MDCKIIHNICVDRNSGSMGKCRNCEFSTNTPPIVVRLSKRDYSFIMDLCGEEMPMEKAVTELVNQGIRSLRRKVKYGKGAQK